MKRAIFLTVVSCFVASEARAQFDVRTQHVRVDLTGGDVVIDVDAEVHFDQSVSSIAMFRPFAPFTSLTIDGVAAERSAHPLAPEWLDRVTPPTPVGPGAATITYRIEGRPTCPAPSNPAAALCWYADGRVIFTPSGAASAWYLVDVFEGTFFTGSIAVVAPSDHMVLAGQDVPSRVEDHGDGTSTFHFDIDLPTSILGLYAGTLERVEGSGPFPVVAHRGPDAPIEGVTEAVERASEGVPALEAFLGTYPAAQANIVTVPRNFAFGGMGMHGTIYIADYIFGPYAFILRAGVLHELAHTYWGHQASGTGDDATAFFSEGFAEYSAWRAIGIAEGRAARRDGVRMNSVWYMYGRPEGVDAPVVGRNTGQSPAYVFVTYHKASSVLRTLEAAVGEAAFDRVLGSLQALGPGGLTIDAFVEAFAAEGYDATGDVTQWLYRTGFPRLEARTEGETLVIDVDGEWQLRVPLEIRRRDGTVEQRVVGLRAGPNAIALGAGVSHVAIDPDWTLVRALKSDGTDVTFDGVVDAADLLEVALHAGGAMPSERRRDGGYDPLYDLDGDGIIGNADLASVAAP